MVKEDGRIFIYTRLKSQNERTIWGMYFPLFSEKENRLYELDEVEQHLQAADSLRLETVKPFKFKQNAIAEHLVEKVKVRHHYTFSLYEKND